MARELSEEEEDAQQLRLGGGEEKLFFAAGDNIQESAKSAFKCPSCILLFSRSFVSLLDLPHSIRHFVPAVSCTKHLVVLGSAEFQKSKCLLNAEVIDILQQRQQFMEDSGAEFTTTP
jgi:hypothetical protein